MVSVSKKFPDPPRTTCKHVTGFILNISLKVAKDITAEQSRMFSILGLNNALESRQLRIWTWRTSKQKPTLKQNLLHNQCILKFNLKIKYGAQQQKCHHSEGSDKVYKL